MNDHDSNLPKYKSFRITNEESRDQKIDPTTWDQKSTKPLYNNNPNLAADFWRRDIGVNVIPADTRNKRTNIPWKQFQDAPIPEGLHEQWKREGSFNNGMAIILGKVWHRRDRQGLYFILVDADKEAALLELCTRNGKTIPLQQMAQKFIVEQHKDNPERAHIYFYSPIPFPLKSADFVLGLEIKSLGEHGMAFCSPSIHKDGIPYEIIGTTEPVVLNITQATELIQHLNLICIRYGIPYLGKGSKLSKLKHIIRTLRIDPTVRIPKGERHTTLLSAADSLFLMHLGKGKKTEQQLKDFFIKINSILCDPGPLSEYEIDSIWNSAINFVHELRKERNDDLEKIGQEQANLIEEICESIKRKHRFVTIEETRDILHYDSGVYVPGGEVLIEKEVELNYGYNVSNKRLAEIKGHVMRSTYRSKKEFDSDLNIINVKNGLYDIIQGKLKEHSLDHLSLNQLPIVYYPRAKTKRLGKFLKEVLYPKEIRTAVEIMAYTLYRDNPFEIITTLFGYGANGKSVFTSLVTSLHGMKNVSNVPLSAILNDIFALSDLENKSVNFDTELSGATIYDTAILKRLTGSQPVRIQRKNQRAYDTTLYTKLFFSANRIPPTVDFSDAYYRRNIILGFPNQFEEGNNADSDLKNKLTTEEELSGIFNVLMTTLRNLLKNKRIFVHEKLIQERRDKYELAVNPIEYFKQEVIAEDSLESDRTLKETLYRAYEIFARENKLPIISKETLGKMLKNKRYGFKEGRESTGRRRTLWKGIKLAEKYHYLIESEQHILAA